MKNSITFLFFLIATATFAANGIVVTQTYSTSVEGQHISVTWYVTDAQCKLKMQFSDKDVNTTSYFIPEANSRQLLTYSDGATPAGLSKIYYRIPATDIKGTVDGSLAERTGETKNIGGMNCEKVIAKSANSVTEMWVTKDFKGDYYHFASFFKNSYELKALSESSIKGFPLSSITKDNGQDEKIIHD